jgi:hypothetical protein
LLQPKEKDNGCIFVYLCVRQWERRGERMYMPVKREKVSMLSMSVPKSPI